MNIISYPRDLSDQLTDLGDSGIHLENDANICHVCDREIEPWSREYGLDALCSRCKITHRQGWLNTAYTPESVWLLERLSSYDGRRYFDIIVKIDDELYHGEKWPGGGFRLHDVRTGETIAGIGLLRVDTDNFEQWHRMQGRAPQLAFCVQLEWFSLKEKITISLQDAYWLSNNIPIYDLGHPKRGWTDHGPVYVRLYLGVQESGNYPLLALQSVKRFDEPFLEGYNVTCFRDDIFSLKWSQAEPVILDVLSEIKADWELSDDPRARSFYSPGDGDERSEIQRALDKARDNYRVASGRQVMPRDATITFMLSPAQNRFSRARLEFTHNVQHFQTVMQ